MSYTHCCVYSEKTADDGQRNCPKHVEFYSKNKFEKLVHLVGFIIRVYITMRGQMNVKKVRTFLEVYFAVTSPFLPLWRGSELRMEINCCSVLKLFVHGYPVLGLLNTRITLSLYVVKIWRDREWGGIGEMNAVL